jgi:hypothetical protein
LLQDRNENGRADDKNPEDGGGARRGTGEHGSRTDREDDLDRDRGPPPLSKERSRRQPDSSAGYWQAVPMYCRQMQQAPFWRKSQHFQM